MATYQKLWDTQARRENRVSYERALKLVMKEKVEVNLAGVQPRRDFKNRNRYRIKHIPVVFYEAEDDVPVSLYRDLTVEKKGLLRQWKLVNDEIFDGLQYSEIGEESIVQVQNDSSASNLNPLTGKGGVIGTHPTPQAVKTDISDSLVGTAPLDTKLKVSQVLGGWQKAWQGRDLEAYMSIYADEAQITRVIVRGGKEYPIKRTKAQLREKMKHLNRRYSKIEVIISNVQINGDSAVADVGFLQEFKGTPASGSQPAYSDYGTKKLILMVDRTDGLWRIYSESWKLYKEVPKYSKL
jgi:ketosteroid isomerase-like protein